MTAADLPAAIATVARPTLILDEARARRNIARMAAKARRAGVRLRPHFKTHQSAQIAGWFREAGVRAATASSLDMAAYFAPHGWDDQTVAFPYNPRQVELVNRLAGSIRLGVLVESAEALEHLARHAAHPLDVWIEVDAGYGRTGLPWDAGDAAVGLARAVAAAERLRLAGLLCHAGQSYAARGAAAVQAVADETFARMGALRGHLGAAGFAGLEVSIGDTPCCSVAEAFPGVDEIRPGNFVFYDLTQLAIGACAEEEIAVAVACPVVARYPERGALALYGGAVHLSKDWLDLPDGRRCFGRVALPTAAGWGPLLEDVSLAGLSQEHGMLQAPRSFVERVALGDLLMVLPVHSCLTADLLKGYRTLGGAELPMFALGEAG